MTKVYISGPISYNPTYRRDFMEAELRLLALGHEVVNPVTITEHLLQLDLSGQELWERCVNDLQDQPEGLDVSVLPTGSVAGLPVALHPSTG